MEKLLSKFGLTLLVMVLFITPSSASEDILRSSAENPLTIVTDSTVTTDQFPVVSQLPEDNLLKNPWFKVGNTPSLEGWTLTSTGRGGWGASQKPGNPTPDDSIGTSARISTGRGADKKGWSVDPGVTTGLYQIVNADPGNTILSFHMYWVTHTVDPAKVTVYGGDSPQGPWKEVWVPFNQTYTKTIRPLSGRGNDLWGFYSSNTPEVSTVIDRGYPYYKLEITGRLPDGQGGFKVTGVYFSVN
jgi:hypothetical protein